MSQTRTIGRYKLKPHATVQEPRQYAVHVTHRDTGVQWLLVLGVDNVAACEAALDQLTIAEIERWTSTTAPLQFPEDPVAQTVYQQPSTLPTVQVSMDGAHPTVVGASPPVALASDLSRRGVSVTALSPDYELDARGVPRRRTP